MKMTKHIRELVAQIEGFPGITVVDIKPGKHLKFVCDTPQGRQVLITSFTPSDWRARKNSDTILKQWTK